MHFYFYIEFSMYLLEYSKEEFVEALKIEIKYTYQHT